MRHRRQTQELQPKVADAIRHLHKHYPYLGHAGIERLLEEEGIDIDPHVLRMFMEDHHVQAEPQATWVNSSDPRQALRMILGIPYPIDATRALRKWEPGR